MPVPHLTSKDGMVSWLIVWTAVYFWVTVYFSVIDTFHVDIKQQNDGVSSFSWNSTTQRHLVGKFKT